MIKVYIPLLIILVLVSGCSTPTTQSSSLNAPDNYKYCQDNYPGTTYNPSTNTCDYPTPVPTSDFYKYCRDNYPGTTYNPSTNTCDYPTPVPTPTFDLYKFCSDILPGTTYNPFSNDCEYPTGTSIVNVKVQGLAASPPANISIPAFVIYNNDGNDGFYLIISPDKTPPHNFAEAVVVGTLTKIPDLDLGEDFIPADFKGIIYANEITQSNPLSTSVQNINQHPEQYAFKRVTIDGIYSTGSSKLGYKKENANYDPRIHLGVGLLGDEFLPEDETKLIVAIDPVNTDWQIRRGRVTGTVLYPTDTIMRYFAQKRYDPNDIKPLLMVEDISEEVVPVSINELYTDLISYQGHRYDGKVVKVIGYALGVNVPVKEVVEKITENQGLGAIVKIIPADVNVQGIAIADSPQPKEQLPLAGLNSELIEGTQWIIGKYEFKVVVTRIDNKPMLFLIKKTELPFDYWMNIPTTFPSSPITPLATPPILGM